MKKANIYKLSIKDKSTKEGRIQITCVATNVHEAVTTATPTFWNTDTQKTEYVKYKENDVIDVKLVEENVIVQNYISDYNEEEE